MNHDLETSERASVFLSDTISVDAPPDRVFPLLTPEGERSWIDGWDPRYPASTQPNDRPGTAFLTTNHGYEAVWIIVTKDDLRHEARYACVIPGGRASLISVACVAAAAGATAATISYATTALSPEWDARVREMEAAYPAMLEGWAVAMSKALSETEVT
jgi:hypothetical protein